MTIHLIIGIILLMMSAVILFIAAGTEDTKSYLKTLFCWITVILAVIFLSIYNNNQPIESNKPFITEIKIRVEVVNDIEISRDTTYILIRSK